MLEWKQVQLLDLLYIKHLLWDRVSLPNESSPVRFITATHVYHDAAIFVIPGSTKYKCSLP